MQSLEVWKQILILVFYLGLYFLVKKFMMAKWRK